jgi:hypothetical protein
MLDDVVKGREPEEILGQEGWSEGIRGAPILLCTAPSLGFIPKGAIIKRFFQASPPSSVGGHNKRVVSRGYE